MSVTVTDAIAANRAALNMIKEEPFNAEAPHAALRDHITSTDEHYVRSNFALPEHDGTLHVAGAVDAPLALTLDDLRARPGADGVELRCEGADHGKYHLSSVLEDVDDLTFVRSLPLAYAADPAAGILIAYEMNGEPLRPDHGAPFRLVVPHWYAVASVKWLTRLDVLTEPFTGEFQTGHYIYQWPDRPFEPVTHMRVRARITDPAAGTTIPAGTYTIRGKAWSGAGPITEVGLSFIGESEWSPAVVEPPQTPYEWQDWRYTWEATPGRHSLRARATDAAGNVQPDVPPWNRIGYGNNAIEISYVEVR